MFSKIFVIVVKVLVLVSAGVLAALQPNYTLLGICLIGGVALAISTIGEKYIPTKAFTHKSWGLGDASPETHTSQRQITDSPMANIVGIASKVAMVAIVLSAIWALLIWLN